MSGWNTSGSGSGSGTGGHGRNQFRSHGSYNDRQNQVRMSPKQTQTQKQNQWGSRSQVTMATTSPNHGLAHAHAHTETPDQLSNLKKQWDVERDIPSGAVRNNPFLPKQEVHTPPPQLMHQKRQWDTSGIIQRGSVAARAMSMEFERAEESPGLSPASRLSPQMQHNRHRFGQGLASPSGRSPSPLFNKPSQPNRRSFPFDNASDARRHRSTPTRSSKAPTPAQAPPAPAPAPAPTFTVATTTSTRHIGNPRLSEQPRPPPETLPSPKWEPSKEIPAGVVKGRLDRLVSPTAMAATTTTTTTAVTPPRRENANHFGDRPQTQNSSHGFHDDASDDDPWIIPSKKTGPTQVFADNWGEALAAKSMESDDWDTPAADWIKSSDSQTTISAENSYPTNPKGRREPKPATTSHQIKRPPQNLGDLGVVEEKKVNEEDIMQDMGKTNSDMYRPSQQDALRQDQDNTFGTTHQRDADILRAARQKSRKPSVDVLQDVFGSETQADHHGFPAETIRQDVFEDAFPSSPFGGNSNFDDFSVDDRSSAHQTKPGTHPSESFDKNSNTVSYEDNFVDAIETDLSHFQNPKSKLSVSPKMEEQHEPVENDTLQKKEKKGFFNKLFGGGRKTRKSTGSTSRKPLRHDASEPQPDHYHVETREFGRQTMKVSTSVISPATDEGNLSPKISSARSEDETTISEMTLPSVFKDHTRLVTEKNKTVAPMLETFQEQEASVDNAYHEDPGFANLPSDSETEAMQVHEKMHTNMTADLRQPPPPPPPPEEMFDNAIVDSDDIQENSGVPTPSGGHRCASPLDTARFNRRVKEFKNNSLRHQNSIAKVVTQEAPSEKRVPTFVARHARNKQVKTQTASLDTASKSPVQPNHDILQSGDRGKFGKKFPKASKAFQQGKMPHGLSSYVATPNCIETRGTKQTRPYSGRSSMIEGNGSTRSQRTVDSSSVGSDIRVLRTILRRPRGNRAPLQVHRPKPAFATYDESSITDPMQRAGLRLLSAAIIPIQTEVRRFLAMRRALTRMWALIVIQAAARRWMVRKEFAKDLCAIVKVQAICRGNQKRSDLIYKHICAIEIQRFVRGYLSTMRVYESIYRVTMVQSYVRMKLAMEEATNRMALVIQLQSVARGFLVRRRLEYQEACAVAIQANWRCFFARLTYQFDLLDVIIVQSVWRRKMATRKIQGIRAASKEKAATLIQAKWRSYDCTMNYLHFLADVLIVQSTIRRFLVLKRVRKMRNDAATKIQSVWRGFVCYADYMFSIADIVVIQKVARRWLATQHVKKLRNFKHCESAVVLQRHWRKYLYARRIQRAWRLKVFKRDRENAALVIQKRWRCFVDETEFVVMKYEYYAARTIQSYWRRFWCFSNFIIALDCSIQIQSAYRGYRQRMELQAKKSSAVRIQCVARSLVAKKTTEFIIRSEQISGATYEQSSLESYAALLIQTRFRAMQARVAVSAYFAARRVQSVVRGHQARTAVRLYVCARRIQAVWRAKRIYNAVRLYVCARRIQAVWRAKRIHTAYRFYRAALLIQTRYRIVRARRDVLVLRGENLATTLIQSAWRGFVCYTDYIFTISDIISAQKTARRFLALRKYAWKIQEGILQKKKEHSSSAALQKVCRGFIARQRYWYTLGCTMQIQSWMRGRLIVLQLRREACARLKLQCFARRCLGRQEYLQRKFILMLLRTADQERTKRVAAMVIQESCRGYLDDRKREEAARVIQRFFLMVKREVDQMVKARKRRKTWRKKMKNRNNMVEDALLEDAWASAVSHSTSNEKHILLSTSSSLDSGPNENLRGNVGKSRDSGGGNRLKGKFQSSDAGRNMKPKLPPRYSDTPSSVVRLHHDDERSEFSGLTASTATYARLQVSRSRRLNPREMDEDLELEEAFIDAEIFSAKNRRLTQSNSMPHVGGGALRGSTKLNVLPSRGSFV
jgi:hypothetical protein